VEGGFVVGVVAGDSAGEGPGGEGAGAEGDATDVAVAALGGDVAPGAGDEDAEGPGAGLAAPTERASPRASRARVTAAAPARLSQEPDSKTRVTPASLDCRTVRVKR